MTIEQIKKKLDRLIQEKNVPLYPRCFVCGNPTHAMHHYIQKSQSMNLRWDERNLIPLCQHCHCSHHISGNPRIHQIIIKKKGHAWADELERDRRVIFKATVSNLKEKLKEYDQD
jgi:5-methylcytosine-specific restriction endonuclease McrA